MGRRKPSGHTGDGFRQDFELEIAIVLLQREQDILRKMQRGINFRQKTISDAKEKYDLAKKRQMDAQSQLRQKEAQAAKYAKDNFWLDRFPKTFDAEEGWEAILADLKRLRAAKKEADGRVEAADRALAPTKAISRTQTAMITGVSTTVLEPLDQLIAGKSKVIDAARDMTDRVMRSVRRVFLNALWILIAVTVAPVFVSAFWFVCIAPLAAGRSTICVWPSAAGGANAGALADGVSSQRALISGVSKEVVLNDQNELLVHPGFLQSAAERSRKSTKWLLTWRFPLASVAAGMVGLIRIRCSTPERFVISSKSDPLVEIGLVDIQDGEALVLQPRALVGVIQRQHRPIAITRKWNFSLAALITLQFRYMIFSGPGTLIVQGCRGVRAENAGDGRSIDQKATIGFSANLQYSAKRSETFGAYLMGMRGLFNDHFSGTPGYYLYEEMPYLAKKSGITGRGLEGLTDALMKAFGI